MRNSISLFLLAAAAAFLIAQCGKSPTLSEIGAGATGSAEITIKVGDVGAMAKALSVSDIDLSVLYLTLSALDEETIRDTIPLSGNNAQTIIKTYSDLASLLKAWTVTAESYDGKGIMIHSGSRTFIVPARDVARVSFDLAASYSMLKATVMSIPDSVTRCELLVDGALRDDSSFAKQALFGQDVTLSYDYLKADPQGVLHGIQIDVYGDMWGFDTLLYTGDTNVLAVSGKDATYEITLYWVGPSAPPPGQATIRVILGAIGTIQINGTVESTKLLPDLIVSSLALSPVLPTVYDSITFAATVKNAGLGTARSSVLALKVGGETTPALYNVPVLAPGQETTITRKLMLGIAQNYLATAIADNQVQVKEADETNNAAKLAFTVVKPVPVLEYTGSELYQPGSNLAVRFKLSVKNSGDFPSHLFEPAPDLPPCGLNTSASRTWVDIFNAADDSRLYGFCALNSPDELANLWFGIQHGTPAPQNVYLVLTDRRTGATYRSNTVSLLEALPQLEYAGAELYETGGKLYVRLKLSVSNRGSYADALFDPMPLLPPCGLNTNAARTWVDVYNDSANIRLYGFCALSGADDLGSLWFAVDHGTVPPEKFYIVMQDRVTGFSYRSNTVTWRVPNPNLAFESMKLDTVNGNIFVKYDLDVANKTAYPAEMFASQPLLPPCGLNTNASRTWVDIFNAADNVRLYGFCALGSPASLGDIWFSIAKSLPTPASIYIIMDDRVLSVQYKSNIIRLPAPEPDPIILFDAGGATGSLGGRQGADGLCITTRNTLYPSIPGTHVRALISVNPSDQIRDMPLNFGIPANRPIYSASGKKIADNWADLLDGSIDMTLEQAGVVTTTQFWYSGSNPDGTLNICNCSGWTSPNAYLNGRYGRTWQTDAGWISMGNATCGLSTYHLLGLIW